MLPPLSSLSDAHSLLTSTLKLIKLYEREVKHHQTLDERTFLNMSQDFVLHKFTPLPRHSTAMPCLQVRRRKCSSGNIRDLPLDMADKVYQNLEGECSAYQSPVQPWNDTPLSQAMQMHSWYIQVSSQSMDSQRSQVVLPSLPGVEGIKAMAEGVL